MQVFDNEDRYRPLGSYTKQGKQSFKHCVFLYRFCFLPGV
jgi:hypothetical protein